MSWANSGPTPTVASTSILLNAVVDFPSELPGSANYRTNHPGRHAVTARQLHPNLKACGHGYGESYSSHHNANNNSVHWISFLVCISRRLNCSEDLTCIRLGPRQIAMPRQA